MEMEAWMKALTERLGVPELSHDDQLGMLQLTRDIAHRVERRAVPLTAVAIGMAVAQRTAAGEDQAAALAQARATVEELLPEAPEED